jgi:sterol desaturase/sphingolipid hydroxylase (fatty acid hydroxylase superfamily)
MLEFIVANEPKIRLSVFLGIFALMALWEVMLPKRGLNESKGKRWSINLGMIIINTLIVRFVFSAGAVGVAVWAERSGYGMLYLLDTSPLFAGLLSIFLLDLAIYTQHVVFHHVGPLWRLHMMHHTDLDLDVTSGARFHPIEIVLSMFIKISIVVFLGAPAWAVVVFEVILNATSMFNHSNVRLPKALDMALRWVVVTPDMHRVHHSVITGELNSNFGFNLPWWDRLFRTYTAQPRDGHDGMTIGLSNFRDLKRLNLPLLIALPFTAKRENL